MSLSRETVKGIAKFANVLILLMILGRKCEDSHCFNIDLLLYLNEPFARKLFNPTTGFSPFSPWRNDNVPTRLPHFLTIEEWGFLIL